MGNGYSGVQYVATGTTVYDPFLQDDCRKWRTTSPVVEDTHTVDRRWWLQKFANCRCPYKFEKRRTGSGVKHLELEPVAVKSDPSRGATREVFGLFGGSSWFC